MTRDVVFIEPQATIRDCVTLMNEGKFRHLPVKDDGKSHQCSRMHCFDSLYSLPSCLVYKHGCKFNAKSYERLVSPRQSDESKPFYKTASVFEPILCTHLLLGCRPANIWCLRTLSKDGTLSSKPCQSISRAWQTTSSFGKPRWTCTIVLFNNPRSYQ